MKKSQLISVRGNKFTIITTKGEIKTYKVDQGVNEIDGLSGLKLYGGEYISVENIADPNDRVKFTGKTVLLNDILQWTEGESDDEADGYRFLGAWNAKEGKACSAPSHTPFKYRIGDSFIVREPGPYMPFGEEYIGDLSDRWNNEAEICNGQKFIYVGSHMWKPCP